MTTYSASPVSALVILLNLHLSLGLEIALGKKSSYIEQHKHSESHKRLEERAALLLQRSQPGTDIHARLTKQAAKQQFRTKRGILSIIDIILALGQRGIPFRGNWDNKEKLEIVNWKSTFHKDLKEHIDHAADSAKHTSAKIQDEVITLCEQAICERIISSIPQYWSLMADETQDCSITEQVSIWYVSNAGEVCENFVGFVKLETMDAQSIADALLSTVQGWGLDMSCLVAQGYDGPAPPARYGPASNFTVSVCNNMHNFTTSTIHKAI